MKMNFNAQQKGEKIFIIGATGFIGFALIKRLIQLGFQNIHCLYRNESKKNDFYQGLDTSHVTFLHGDVSQMDVLKKGIEGASIILNASGMATDWGIKSQIWEVNVNAPKAIVKMLENMKAKTHFIQITSATVYGFSKREKTENSPLKKSDRFYSASKIELHAWLRTEMQKPNPFPITILAPSIVWGSGDQIYIPLFIDRLKKGQLFSIGKDEKIDFIHIDDLVDAFLLCFFNKQAHNKEFIINGSELFTFKEYIDKIAHFCELLPPSKRVSTSFMIMMASMMELKASIINLFKPQARPLITRLVVHLLSTPMRLNSDYIKKELGFTPEIDFKQGVEGVEDYIVQSGFAGPDSK